jgi:type I restriction enzyme R subunit
MMLQLRPTWTEKVKVVMTAGNNDPEEWHDIIGNDTYKKELAKKFKDNNDPMKIAIVVDMWLTGFDVPSLATMYVFKPMSGHNLMQAIARVNRVYKDKVGGLVVDYIGIAQALKEAMKFYTSNDRRRFGDPDIAKTAYVKFREHLEICADLMHGFDYSGFATATDNGRGMLIKQGANFMMAVGMEKKCNDFKKHAQLLHQAYSLCHSLIIDKENWDATFFETIRVMLVRLAGTGKISKREIDRRIRELLQQSVQSEGIINLFKDENKEFSLNDPAFMEEVAKMKEKNLAVELLKKIIAEKVRTYKRTNIVQSDKFSDLLNESLKAYLNGMLTNEQVIEELLKLANQIKTAEEQGKELGLSSEEKAFYDALSQPQAVKDAYSNDELVGLTRKLTNQLSRNRTIDWQEKDSARAKMRLMVKKLLKKYHYPPEEAKNAMETVIKQCELWTDKGEAEDEIAQEIASNIDLDNMQDYAMAAEPSIDE